MQTTWATLSTWGHLWEPLRQPFRPQGENGKNGLPDNGRTSSILDLFWDPRDHDSGTFTLKSAFPRHPNNQKRIMFEFSSFYSSHNLKIRAPAYTGARFLKNHSGSSKLQKSVKNHLKWRLGSYKIDPGASKMLCEKCWKNQHRKKTPNGSPKELLGTLPHFWISEGSGVLESFFKGEAL